MLRFVQRDQRPFSEREAAALRPYEGVTARLLYARGIATAKEAQAFLHPDLSQLHDPMLMHGMKEAVQILSDARDRQLPTVVYGDYDVDGICACSLLTLALRRFGVNADTHTPLRAEGYGLNCEAVRELAKTYRVLVTVDLGITNHEEVRLAQELGMRVVVTDHHGLALEKSPADAVMNPLLGDYPFRKLCGTGVAFKLATALLGLDNCYEYLDLAALATVADIVPLQDENRVIVSLGLKVIESRKRPGIRALLSVSGDPERIDSDTLGYRLGPRLNAAGRLDDAGKGVRLMMTTNPAEAEALAVELDELNTRRKTTEQTLVKLAEEAASHHDFIQNRALIVKGSDWHVGVIGLAAGRLCTHYFCPTCVLSEHEGILHGSLRSIPGVNIHKCLQTCDDLLLRYGGHEQAAGVTLSVDNFEAFCERMQKAVSQADESCFIPAQEYDAEITLPDCTEALLSELDQMAPFGCGNPAPLFLSRGLHPEEFRAVGADGAHLKLTLRQEGKMMGGIAFGMGKMAADLPDRIDAAFSLSRNTFRGTTSLQMQMEAIQPVNTARMESLEKPNPAKEGMQLLDSLLDAFSQKAGKEGAHTEPIQERDFSALQEALDSRERGHLLVSHTAMSALTAMQMADVDVCANAPGDPRGFATLVTAPLISMAQGHWRHVWLLDGEICPGEAERWQEKLPQAQVHICPTPQALRALAKGIDAGDAAYRVLYKTIRQSVLRTIGDVAKAAGLSVNQTRAGLHAFRELGLIELHEAPFRYAILPAQKCQLGDSRVLSALRRLS